MNAFITVFIGGGLGSLLRYGISVWMGKHESGFPTATLAANILGCLILGIAWMYFSKQVHYTEQVKLLIMTGFCGGFSTFSTFSLETLQLIQNEQMGMAIIYVLTSVLCSLVVLTSLYKLML